MNAEPGSDLWRMDCWTKDMLLSLCLSDGDLRFLGVWKPARAAFPCERTCALARLHGELHSETALAHQVADLLDVRHVEAILDVSGAAVEELRSRFTTRTAAMGSSTGLLWALCTDSRSPVRLLGRTLLREELELALATRRGSVRVAARGA